MADTSDTKQRETKAKGDPPISGSNSPIRRGSASSPAPRGGIAGLLGSVGAHIDRDRGRQQLTRDVCTSRLDAEKSRHDRDPDPGARHPLPVDPAYVPARADAHLGTHLTPTSRAASSETIATSPHHDSSGLTPRDYLNASQADPAPFDFCPVFGPGDPVAERRGQWGLLKSRLHQGSNARVQRVIQKALSGMPVTISVLGGSGGHGAEALRALAEG